MVDDSGNNEPEPVDYMRQAPAESAVREKTEEELRNDADLELLSSILLLLRTTQAHSLNNDALLPPIRRLTEFLGGYLQEHGPAVSVAFTEENTFVNKRLLRVDASHYESMYQVRQYFMDRNVGEVEISAVPPESDLRNFLAQFKSSLTEKVALDGLIVGPIRLHAIKELKETSGGGESGLSLDARKNVLRVYAKTLVFMEDFFKKAADGKVTSVAKLRRAVQELIDISKDTEHLFLGLVQLKEYREHLYNHCVNVAILSLMLGKMIDLSKKQMIELGLCALMHDIGKAQLPTDLQMETRELTDQDKSRLEEVPWRTVALTLKKSEVNQSTLRRALVGFEHATEMRARDRVFGTPSLLFSRIVAIVNEFDELTTRTTARKAYTPDVALRVMQQDKSGRFDADLISAFIGLVGVYPIGSTVWLDGGQIAVVFNVHREPGKFLTPIVRILSDRSGQLTAGTVVDLAENSAAGQSPGRVVGAVDLDELPEPPGIRIPQVFFS